MFTFFNKYSFVNKVNNFILYLSFVSNTLESNIYKLYLYHLFLSNATIPVNPQLKIKIIIRSNKRTIHFVVVWKHHIVSNSYYGVKPVVFITIVCKVVAKFHLWLFAGLTKHRVNGEPEFLSDILKEITCGIK